MQSIHFQPVASQASLLAVPSTKSHDTTIAQLSPIVLHSHRRKQATPRRAIKKSEVTSNHATLSDHWTQDQITRLLKVVKEHKGPKSREFWSWTAKLFSNSRTSEACRKKYYKIKLTAS